MKKTKIICLIIIIGACIGIGWHRASASTTITTTQITEDTIWTKEGSPYYLNNHVQINKGVTLTIEPGVIIKIHNPYEDNIIYIDVYGRIITKSTPDEKIYITSIDDDSIGGDARNDGDTIPPGGKEWVMYFYEEAQGSIFDNVEARYGTFIAFQDQDIEINGLTLSHLDQGLMVLGGDPDHIPTARLWNFNASDISSVSIYAAGVDLHVEDSKIQNSRGGIELHNANLDLKDSSIRNLGDETALSTYDDDTRYGRMKIDIERSIFQNGNSDGLRLGNKTDSIIEKSTIQKFKKAGTLSMDDGSLAASGNIISRNEQYGLSNTASLNVLATGNYWGDQSGPYNESNNESGTGNKVSSKVDFIPWLTSDPFTATTTPPIGTTTVNSNVVFIPGLEASRLYRDQVFQNQLWEPNRNDDVKKLYLDSKGASIDPSIYVGDPIKTTNLGIFNKNIYKAFYDEMDGLVRNRTINDWKALPYDWRLDLRDIVDKGVKSKDHISFMENDLMKIASSSKTGKVTIVTHSNGGLLAKTLIDKMKAEGKAGLVDKLIMVAAPELGSATTIGSLLHGDDQALPFVMSKSTARGLGENMSGAYNLLPSEKYFENNKEAVVEFDPSVDKVNNFRSRYGDSVKDRDSLGDFLSGKEGRSDPSVTDTMSPNVLSQTLLTEGSNVHSIIDAWEPPRTLKVTEIAGFGMPTTRGIKYRGNETCVLGIALCSYSLDHEMLKNSDGDGTVMTRSATAVGNERRYLDLRTSNKEKGENISHASIFESNSLNELIKNIIGGKNNLPAYISNSMPERKPSFLKVSVHSPVSLDAYDGRGNHTGNLEPPSSGDIVLKDETIPNSSYEEIGEGKYITLDGSEPSTLKLQGEDIGTFTLTIERVDNDNESRIANFINIPVTPMLKGEVYVSSMTSAPLLSLDVDGDGKRDATVSSQEKMDPISYLDLLKKIIGTLGFQKEIEKTLIQRIDKIEKTMGKGKDPTKAIEIFNKKMTHFTSNKPGKPDQGKSKKISSENALTLVTLLTELLNNLEK